MYDKSLTRNFPGQAFYISEMLRYSISKRQSPLMIGIPFVA